MAARVLLAGEGVARLIYIKLELFYWRNASDRLTFNDISDASSCHSFRAKSGPDIHGGEWECLLQN